MQVQIGNDAALEGYRDPTSDDPDAVRYRPLEGQQITTLNLPDDMGLQEAFSTVVTGMGFHMESGAKPAWIEATSAGLQALLQEHFGVTNSQNTRPKTWGKDTSAAFVTPEGA